MENKKDKRMIELMHSLEVANEVYKIKESINNTEDLIVETDRLKKLISEETNSDFKNSILPENYYIAGKFGTGGRGRTVNSIIDDYKNSSVVKTPKPSSSNLKPDEALEVSIKRVLKSGTPINNISFYDEVNYNLMNLGFPAVNEINIKTAILGMIGE